MLARSLQFALPVRTVREIGRIKGPWHIDFEAGRGAPANAVMPEMALLNENADPAIRYFSGIASYEHDFSLPRSWKRGEKLLINLGEAEEVARVSVNGRLAGYAWHAPYLVDLPPAARPGRNHLRIQIANLWVNRLIGDAQPRATKVGWTATPTYLTNAPLRRSGLIGQLHCCRIGRAGIALRVPSCLRAPFRLKTLARHGAIDDLAFFDLGIVGAISRPARQESQGAEGFGQRTFPGK